MEGRVMVQTVIDAAVTSTGRSGFGDLLARWRKTRRMSQLGLALEAEISSRHLSFVETGRAPPSRETGPPLARPRQRPPRERRDPPPAGRVPPPGAQARPLGPAVPRRA